MFRQVLTGIAVIGSAIVSWPLSALDLNAQTFENNTKICNQQVKSQERAKGIPTHLLSAISLAESGRWDKTRKANVAWPWTVTSGGEGRFFDTKEEAMAEVEFLLTDGTRNIDVGCMQINLLYHANAFETLSDAFDPKTNTAYAASFLSALRKKTGNWIDAAGKYHSSTPEKKQRYLKKVLAFWNKKRGLNSYAQKTTKQGQQVASLVIPAPASSVIDYQRVNRLNAAFKKRRAGNPLLSTKALTAAERAQKRHEELQAWNKARAQGLDMKYLLAMRRAQQKLQERKRFATTGSSKFPKKRKKQLKKWRDKGIWYGG